MEVLSEKEIGSVNGGVILDSGVVLAPRAVRSGKKLDGIWGAGDPPGTNKIAYEKYLAALATWQARHPNLDPAIFDSIYFRK
ncbi:MAG: hypothetical protein ACJLS3_09290 [Erythrobacter sp.]